MLTVNGVSKAFGVVQALKDVSLTIREAEVHAVVGENGAGKSTLMNIIAGILNPDEGTFF
ncbi:MAG: ATP-binding cassette domain-containing protein, partial [Desulfobacterales bacterium]